MSDSSKSKTIAIVTSIIMAVAYHFLASGGLRPGRFRNREPSRGYQWSDQDQRGVAGQGGNEDTKQAIVRLENTVVALTLGLGRIEELQDKSVELKLYDSKELRALQAEVKVLRAEVERRRAYLRQLRRYLEKKALQQEWIEVRLTGRARPYEP